MKFCVIGLGRFGYQIAQTLAQNGMEVLAIDRNEAVITSISDKVTQAVCMNVSDEETLRAVDIEDMDTVVVAMGENIEQSVLVTALLKKHLKAKRVVARATNQIHETILSLVGADKVVIPEREEGIRLANNISLPFLDFINVLDDFSITVLRAPEPFIGKKISDLDLVKKYDTTCIGLKKGNDITLVAPAYVVAKNDLLVFAGENRHLEELTRL